MEEMKSTSRKWEELDPNLLAEVFGRLDLGDLLLSIPFVCKPWKATSMLPRCWRTLKFTKSYEALVDGLMLGYHLDSFSFSDLFKLVLSKSQGSATHLVLPPTDCYREDRFTTEDLVVLSNECPKLKLMAFFWMEAHHQEQLSKLIGKWKDLEVLCIRGRVFYFEEFLTQISNNCENFVCLQLVNMPFDAEMVSAIAKHLPMLKHLYLWNLKIEKELVMRILKGCKHLIRLSFKNCIGFVADEEILELGNSVKNFTCEGCQLFDEEEYYYESISTSDVYDGNSDDGYEI